jgi:hypothetical protein
VVRENIIAVVNDGVGLTIAENPQATLYELKLGYIRNQFYSIPTTKRVDDSGGSTEIGTPQVVSGFGADAQAERSRAKAGISGNFVVGDKAVWSPAAFMMYGGAHLATNVAGMQALSVISTNLVR